MSTVKEMTVGFPEWTGIYILIYSQTRNAVGRGLLFKDECTASREASLLGGRGGSMYPTG